MQPTHHDLRLHRRQTCLSQQDIAELLGTKDDTQVSRHENYAMQPQMEMCMLYHLLFGVDIQNFFPQQKHAMTKRLILRIPNIIDEYKLQLPNREIQEKVEYLTTIVTRLTTV